MKIYFAGSIRGGREDVETYGLIVNHLKKHGEVYTEVIADKTLTKDDRVPENKEDLQHEKNMFWFGKSDVIIAEVTQPSLGVGYELGRAVEVHKKTLCLFNPKNNRGHKLSAMIRGVRQESFVVKDYTDPQELPKMIDDYLRSLGYNIA